MDFNTLFSQLQKRQFAQSYLLDGEESYYIDKLIHFFEEQILLPEERDFNLIVLYGKENTWQDVVNAARRFPMFAERLVVILKEASQMKDLGALEAYVKNPSPTTLLVIEHRFKKADARSKLLKTIQNNGVHYTSDKLKDDAVPQWVNQYGQSVGLQIGQTEAEMLSVFLGNDLQKIANELEKIRINEPALAQLTTAHIEQYIGISREYNAFELPDVLFAGDRNKLARMMQYFVANPKAAPLQMIIGTLYSLLSKVYLCYYTKADFAADKKLGIWSKHRNVAKQYHIEQIKQSIALLEVYSHKAVGVNSSGTDVTLLKEMIGRYMQLLYRAA